MESSLDALAERARTMADQLESEEAVKHALVMPLIQALGYNPFDPMEVVPEFTADVGTKKGEKVDYAIIHDGKPSIIFECKQVSDPLDESAVSQLYRYFAVTEASIGVLTNGITYKFFSDLDDANKMDDRPFFEFNLLDKDERPREELKRFEKQTFDVEKTVEAAAVLKYVRGMKRTLKEQMAEPDEDFVSWLAHSVYTGRLTQPVRERFTRLTVRAFREFVNDQIKTTLQTAMDESKEDEAEPPDPDADEDRGIVTTAHEQQGFMIVKAILCDTLDVARVAIRDTKSYCGILLDDTNRQPICRLHFNNADRLSIGVFDDDRNEIRHDIESLDGIYQHAEIIRRRARLYDQDEVVADTESE